MMTAAEMENALCSVKRPRGQLKTRGLHFYDLMKISTRFRVAHNGGYKSSVTNFPFVLGLTMRLHGDGAKAVGKKLGRPWEPFQNIVRDLGLKPLTNNESRNRPTLLPDDKAQRLYEEAAMKSIGETRKDMTWAKHPAYVAWYSMQRYYQQNPERPVYLSDEERKKRARESARMSAKNQRQNPIFRIKENIRRRLRDKLKGSSGTTAVTGCTSAELRQWLESQFKGSMSWDNYGTAWHVDHIRPCASFDVSIKADRLAMNHYTNLQPMWAKTNIKKSDSWDGQYEFAHEIL
jgi:hypothetical protein